MKKSVPVLCCATFVMMLPTGAEAQWWNPLAPKTFAECLLKEMKGAPANATRVAAAVCRQRFPVAQACKARDLKPAELKNITGTADNLSSRVHIDLYNGNASITLYEVAVKIGDTRGQNVRIYRVAADTAPLAQETVSFRATVPAAPTDRNDFYWDILTAKGC